MTSSEVVRKDVGVDVGAPVISKLFYNLTIKNWCKKLSTDVFAEVSFLNLLLFFLNTD